MLAGMGLKGWKKNCREVIGKPDVAFPIQKVAIFLDGCFWHGCPHCQRPLPQTNSEYWRKKIERNKELANIYQDNLSKNGWSTIRIWEHEMRDIKAVRARIRAILKRAE